MKEAEKNPRFIYLKFNSSLFVVMISFSLSRHNLLIVAIVSFVLFLISLLFESSVLSCLQLQDIINSLLLLDICSYRQCYL